MSASSLARRAADAVLCRGLERIRGSAPALVAEYPLDLRSRWGWGGSAQLTALSNVLEASSDDYEDLLSGACELLDWARGIPRTSSGQGRPYWENDWWGNVDALVQCAALKQRDPVCYLEIGSGLSTMFARRAIDDFSLRTRIVSVDPAPHQDIDGLCDEVIREPLQQVADTVLERLSPGDVVFIDGSHVALMNSDATVFFLEMLHRLPSGVVVGIDDIFLPWDYPPTWSRRVYGEQYLLAAFLLGGGAGFKIRFPGWWVTHSSRLSERLDPVWPVVENRFGRFSASFWLESLGG